MVLRAAMRGAPQRTCGPRIIIGTSKCTIWMCTAGVCIVQSGGALGGGSSSSSSTQQTVQKVFISSVMRFEHIGVSLNAC